MTKVEQINAIKQEPTFFLELGQKIKSTGVMEYLYVETDKAGKLTRKSKTLFTKGEGTAEEQCLIERVQTIPIILRRELDKFISYSITSLEVKKLVCRFSAVTYDDTSGFFVEKNYFSAKVDNKLIVKELQGITYAV